MGIRQKCAAAQDCALHHSEPLVATALIDGRLIAHRFNAGAGSYEEALDMKVCCTCAWQGCPCVRTSALHHVSLSMAVRQTHMRHDHTSSP